MHSIINTFGIKKILGSVVISFILILFSVFSNNLYADNTDNAGKIPVQVTEEIPGANCVTNDGKTICYVEKGFKSVTSMLGNIIKYFTFLAGLGGVLFIVINGILYSMGGIDGGGKDEAKKRIVKTLIGLAILLLSGVILNAIAPWIYTF